MICAGGCADMDPGAVPCRRLCRLSLRQHAPVAAVWRQAAAHLVCLPGMSASQIRFCRLPSLTNPMSYSASTTADLSIVNDHATHGTVQRLLA